MESIVRDVRDIDAGDRHAIEHVVGRQLRDNQRLIIQLAEIEIPLSEPSTKAHSTPTLPDWCNVYEGLSDQEIAEIEAIALNRANLTRQFD